MISSNISWNIYQKVYFNYLPLSMEKYECITDKKKYHALAIKLFKILIYFVRVTHNFFKT